MKAPVAKREPKTIYQMNRVRIDDYAWMKDDNWKEVLRDPSVLRPDIREHLTEENAYTDAMLGGTEALQAQLFEEMKGRIKQDDSSVPSPDGAWDYYVRYETGAEHPIHGRRPRGRMDGEQVLLDEEALAKGKAFFQVGAAHHSPDHRLYAWAADEQGSEYYTLRVRDLATGKDLPFTIESAYGDFTFSPDSHWLFWIWRDENARPSKVYRRSARGGEDVLVYEEADDGMFLGVGTTSDDSHVLIHVGNQETTEILLISAADPTAPPIVAEPRSEGIKYDLDHWTDHWVIRTNAEGAVDFKLARSEANVPSRNSWVDFVAHTSGRYITGFALYAGHLVRAERVDANDQLIIMARSGGEHRIAFEEEAYALDLSGGFEYETTVTKFVYQSPTTPRQWFDYDMVTQERTLRKTQEIPSGHDPSLYVARRLNAPAPDGQLVPITVLMRRDTPLDGSAPLLLYGYGSYGHAMDPSFSIRNLSLVDRGWVWATAHIRGGSDKGWGWFLDGRKENKTNTFKDFIACADYLADQSYSARGRMVAYGGSAGGMLMGAVANMAPYLWAGIIAAVPFVDVLNTMSDTSLPLTPPEWPEWGNPLEDAAAYDRIAGYSPYDNVDVRPYPPILATGGLSDPRVTYWEPQKWVAKLRAKTTSSAPVLLKINMEAGHGGASGRFDFLKEIALDYAFAIWALERGWEKDDHSTLD